MVKQWIGQARNIWVAGLLLLLPVIVIVPNLDTFPYPRFPGAYSDLAVTHYPNAYFMRQELLAHRTIPLWSPAILSGYPFVANPLSGLLYPPGWLALLLSIPAGFHIVAAMHLIWGGVGMLRLLRAEGLGFPAALFGGLAFELMPKIAAHYGAGHLTLLYALMWTPWLLLSWRGYEQIRVKMRYGARRWIKPSLILALIFLADVRWFAFAGALWIGYVFAHSHNSLRVIRPIALQSGLAIMLSAPLSLPLLEYVLLSSRSKMTTADILTLSLPPARMLGFVYPDLGGFYEWVLYPGAVILCLGLAAVVGTKHHVGQSFWIWVVLVSILMSLGNFVPGMEYLVGLPGFSLLRVPSRALFITGLALAALAGSMLDSLEKQFAGLHDRLVKLVLIGLACFTLVFAAGVSFITHNISLPFSWGAGIILLSVLWIVWGINGAVKVYRNIWQVGLFAIAIVDWAVVDLSYLAFRPSEEVLAENVASAEWLARQPGLFRVYSPSYSIPQATAAQTELQLADGVDPLQLESYVTYMEVASGVPRLGYSVTMPPFANGDPVTSNSSFVPDPALLGLLNVKFVASAFELTIAGLEFKTEIEGTRLYENQRVLPRAWVQPVEVPPGEQINPALIYDLRANRVSAEALGPGLFVLSEIFYPGWRAYIDGKRVPIQPVAGILRGVHLESGRHQIYFQYVPLSFYIGLAVCLVGLAIYIWEEKLL